MAWYTEATRQANEFWTTRTSRQKTLLLSGAGGTLLLLALMVGFLVNPSYKPLYADLSPEDAQSLTTQLDAEGIAHRASTDGKTISVPADKLDVARMQTAVHGMPHSGRTGFELFDKMSWGQTEFDEKVSYQRALEGELEKTIETLNGVESARVHLVMPTDSVFTDRQRAAKASVILKLKRDGLSKDAPSAITRLVVGAVDELQPDDVSIIDADTDRLLGQQGEDKAVLTESVLSHQLIATLEPVVGVGRIRADVNVSYDQGTIEDNQEKYDPAVSALLNVQKTQSQSNGADGGGVPGTDSNVPSAKQADSANIVSNGDGQSSRSENAQYGVNKEMIHTVQPAGRVQRITAAILVDDAVKKNVENGRVTFSRVKRSPQQLQQIAELAKASIGFDPKRGDSVSVQNMSFDPEGDIYPATTSWSNELKKMLSDYASLLRLVSVLTLLGLAYFLVLRPVQRQIFERADQELILESSTVQPLPLAITDEASEDNRRASQLREQTLELIRQKPQNTTRTVQAWLREDAS